MRIPYIAGNWKMNLDLASAREFVDVFTREFKPNKRVKVAICAPFLQLPTLSEKIGDSEEILLGAQNLYYEDSGAFTGEISGSMLKMLGVDCCIVGHSERRTYFGETDEIVNKKVMAAYKHGLEPILCVGENLEQREAGEHIAFVKGQVLAALKNVSPEQALSLTVAYEPIWAIGTGKTAGPEQAQEMCAAIRGCLADYYGPEVAEKIIIQYGGSVKPSNAAAILNMPDVDGALVGGAALDPMSFIDIINF